MKTDLELKTDVEDELNWHPRVNGAQIGVMVKDGVVSLTGYVDSWSEKHAVEEAVKSVAHVLAVAEAITVRTPGPNERTDTDIASACANVLAWNTWVPQGRVSVRVQNGWITIEGEVQSQYQKSAAEGALRDLLGVKGITDLVTIKPKAKPTQVKEAIHRAFARHAQIGAGRIGVDVHDSRITLHGNVNSWAERADAEAAAWAAPGVAEVDNRIRIAP